ncbi:MAG: hypothetical protein KDI21_17035, partial [Halieaceae bacterium]|nr:hypothetical protein [Halieaceae bacterium]
MSSLTGMLRRLPLLLATCVACACLGATSQAQETPEPAAAAPQISNLDQLLDAVRQQQRHQRELNTRREQEFLRDKRRQEELLAQARRDFERR